MRPLHTGLLLLLGAASLVGASWRQPDDASQQTVLVELFTSQGCSSCPPADRLLPELQDRLGSADLEIVPLSFHVDYWNRLGWRDPFSDEGFSIRQRQYAEWMKEGRVYTPQVVIGGSAHCVGSDFDCLRRWLGQVASNRSRATVSVDASRAGDTVVAEIGVQGNQSTKPLVLFAALRQRELVTEVRSGENARRTLTNDFVVRRLVALKEVPAGTRSTEVRSSLRVASAWGSQPVDVVAFLQDPRSGKVHGAGQSSGAY